MTNNSLGKQIPAALLVGIHQHGMDRLTVLRKVNRVCDTLFCFFNYCHCYTPDQEKFFSVADPASPEFEERLRCVMLNAMQILRGPILLNWFYFTVKRISQTWLTVRQNPFLPSKNGSRQSGLTWIHSLSTQLGTPRL